MDAADNSNLDINLILSALQVAAYKNSYEDYLSTIYNKQRNLTPIYKIDFASKLAAFALPTDYIYIPTDPEDSQDNIVDIIDKWPEAATSLINRFPKCIRIYSNDYSQLTNIATKYETFQCKGKTFKVIHPGKIISQHADYHIKFFNLDISQEYKKIRFLSAMQEILSDSTISFGNDRSNPPKNISIAYAVIAIKHIDSYKRDILLRMKKEGTPFETINFCLYCNTKFDSNKSTHLRTCKAKDKALKQKEKKKKQPTSYLNQSTLSFNPQVPSSSPGSSPSSKSESPSPSPSISSSEEQDANILQSISSSRNTPSTSPNNSSDQSDSDSSRKKESSPDPTNVSTENILSSSNRLRTRYATPKKPTPKKIIIMTKKIKKPEQTTPPPNYPDDGTTLSPSVIKFFEEEVSINAPD
mgnify:CR=1 FL=1